MALVDCYDAVMAFLSLPRPNALSLTRMATLALVSMTSVACVSKPTMHLNHAEISGFQMTIPPTVLMTVVVDVHNPNGYDVAIRAMRGTVTMAGKYTVPLDFRAPGDGVWLAAKQTTAVRTPIAIPVDIALQMIREAAMSPTIAYRMVGKADVTGTRTFKIEEDNYAVDENGSITRDQMIAIIPNTIQGPH